MFKKHVIASLVALGLLATSVSPAFAEDTTTGSTGSTDGAATVTGVATTGTTVDTTTTDKNKEESENKDNKDEENKTKDLANDKKVDLVCMQTAVEKRDNAVIGALDTFYANVKTGLTARRDALKAAWGVEDGKVRNEAIRKALKDFKGTWKSGKKALKEAQKATWKQFKADRKTCGGTGEGEGEGEGNDMKL